jgi:gliding motility-associated-like protein
MIFKIKTNCIKKTIKIVASLMLMFFSLVTFSQAVVVTHPSDTSLCAESSAKFRIVAVNTSGYQWQENDGVGWYNLTTDFTYAEGQFTPELTIIDANIGLNGYFYRCVVNDINNNTDTSSAALLNVYEPPIITQDPQDDRVCKNEIAVFSVMALNGTHYQWQEFSGIGWVSLEDNSFYSGSQTPDLSIFTTTGMDNFKYRCLVKHISCPDTSDFSLLHVDPTPIIYTITGGGEYCQGSNGVEIGLNDSEMGISYDLILDDISTGIVLEGTGEALNFGFINIPGIYTATAYNQFSGCSVEMSATAEIINNPLPEDFPVQGGGNICQGDEGKDIFILSSQSGIRYDLYRNGIFTEISLDGTGFALNFGNQNQSGFYTILATNTTTSCTKQMSGNAQIIVNEIPLANAGDDKFITQGNTVQLSGSAINGSGNHSYEWSPSNLCLTPSNAITTTNPLYISTIFTFKVSDNQTGCFSKNDTAIIYVNSGPLSVQTYSDVNNICSGGNINLMAIPAGGTGNYGYLWSSSPPGFSSTLQNPNVTPTNSTTYFLEVFDGNETVYDSVSVFINPSPLEFNLQGGGAYCLNGEGKEIYLSNSEFETSYFLLKDGIQVSEKSGNGQNLSFGNIINAGTYSALAINNVTGCSTQQNGDVEISINELPIAEAGENKYILAGENVNFDGSASGGAGNYTFQWSPADSLLNPNVQSPSSIPLHSTTIFKLKVSDENNCQSLDDNVIAFVSGGVLNLEIITSEYPVCAGEDIQLFALASGGSGNFSYIWESIPSGFVSTLFNPEVNPETDTWFKVIASDGLQTISDSVFLTVNASPQVFDVLGGGSYCQGSSLPEITLQSSELQTEYQLIYNGNPTSTIIQGNGNPLSFGTFSEAGEYHIVANNIYLSCLTEMNNSVTITQLNSPQVNAGFDQTVAVGNTCILTGEVTNGSGSYIYNWQPTHLLQTPNSQNTLTQNIYQPTTFSFRVTDSESGCLSNIDSVKVFTSGGKLFASATAESGTICEGSSSALYATAGNGTGNYSYSWTSNPSGTYGSEATISVQPQISTTYFLHVFDGLNNAYDTIEIMVANNPQAFNILGGGEYCQGEDGLNISLSNSQNGVDYNLFLLPETQISNIVGTGSSISFGNFLQSGTYVVRASNQNNCKMQMNGEVSIIRNIPPSANAGSDKSINSGEITILNGNGTSGSGNYNYLWMPADSLVNNEIQNVLTKNLHATTQFVLELTDAQTGCSGIENDEVVVFVGGGNLELNLLSSKSAVCPDEEFQLFALATGGSGNFTYAWTADPEGFSASVYNPIISQQQTTIYTVNASDGINTISKSIEITLNKLPTPFELNGGGEICRGENPDEIILNSSETNTTYRLFQNNNFSGLEKQGNGFALNFGVWNENGNYYVVAENNQSNCSNQMAANVIIDINEPPVANAGNDQQINIGNSTILNGTAEAGSGSYLYSWQPISLIENPNSQNTQTEIIDQTTLFTLKVKDLNTQCLSEQDTSIVFVKGGNLTTKATAIATTICLGENTTLFAIASGGTGNFTYSWTSEPEGFYSESINPNIEPAENTTYLLEVFDGISLAYAEIEIVVGSSPQVFNLIGGGDFCEGENGVEIELSGSETNTDYVLFQNPQNEINTLSGTGSSISFGLIDEQGSYYVVANNNQSCTKPMNGEAIIQQNPLPVAQAGQDFNIEYGDQTSLNGNALGGSGNYNYFWSPADSLTNSNSQNPLTNPLHATTLFSLSVSDANTTCTSNENDETVVFVSGGPFLVHTTVDNNLVCAGEEISLYCLASGGSGNYSYLWESIPSGFASNENNPTANPLVSTMYYVSISDGSTIITDSVAVNVNPNPTTFNLLGGGEFCSNNDGIELSLSNSELSVNYNLFNNNGFTGISLNGNNDILNFGTQSQEGEYFVIAENILNLCNSQMNNTANIIVHEVPLALAGFDQFIQSGESTQLSGDGNGSSESYIFDWSPDYLLENSNIKNPITIELNTSTYFLLNVTDAQTSCVSNSDSLIIYVTGGPLMLDVSASENSICSGLNTQLYALASGGNGNYEYHWTTEDQDFESRIQSPMISPTISKWYFIELSDGNESVKDSILIEVKNNPEVFQINGGGQFCQGEAGKNISLSGSETNTIYQLFRNGDFLVNEKIGDGSSINFGEISESGTYTAYAYNSNSYCEENMIGSAVIIKNPLPVADAGSDKIINAGGFTTLNGNASAGSGTYLYNWTPTSKLINPNDQNPSTVQLNQSTLYNLSVTDQKNGCNSLEEGSIVFVKGGNALSVEIINQATNVCPGQESTLIAIPTGGSGDYNYYWTSNPSGFISSSNEININPLENTWFIVQVSDGTLMVKDSIAINTLAIPNSFNMSGGGGYCPDEQGVNIFLDNSETGVSYSLYHNVQQLGINMAGTGNSLDFGKVISAGTYSVRAKATNQCVALMNNSVQVVEEKKPTKFQLHGGGNYCENDPSLGILLESSEKNVNYQLLRNSENTGISREGTGLPLSFINMSGNGIFTVTATNSLSGCFDNMSGAVSLIINENPNISISGKSEICLGESTILSATGGINYEWNTFPIQHIPAINVSPEFNTVYTVTSTNDSGCSDIDSIKVNVYDHPAISLQNDLISYSIVCSPNGLANYEFYHGGELIQNGSSNELFYGDLSLDADTLKVVATNSSGCSDIDAIFLEMGEIPNAFSPDGDGKNERFLVDRDLTVFDRWGKEIYNGTDGWDGYYNGKIVSPGTYYYVNNVFDSEGNIVKTNKGSVTLVIK